MIGIPIHTINGCSFDRYWPSYCDWSHSILGGLDGVGSIVSIRSAGFYAAPHPLFPLGQRDNGYDYIYSIETVRIYMYIYVQIVSKKIYELCFWLSPRVVPHVLSGRWIFVHIYATHTHSRTNVLTISPASYWPVLSFGNVDFCFCSFECARCGIGIDDFFCYSLWMMVVMRLLNKFTDESNEYFVIIKLWIIQQKYTLTKWNCGWMGSIGVWFWWWLRILCAL